MRAEEFNILAKQFTDEMLRKLVFKRKEYAKEDDVLINFIKGSEISQTDPAEVARMYALKHAISIRDFLDDFFNWLYGSDVRDFYKWDEDLVLEKFTDFANYLVLLFAIYREAREKDAVQQVPSEENQ